MERKLEGWLNNPFARALEGSQQQNIESHRGSLKKLSMLLIYSPWSALQELEMEMGLSREHVWQGYCLVE